MGYNFPDTPTLNQVSGPYTWDGEKWIVTPGTGGNTPSSANPIMDSVAAPGVALPYSREDHVHPSDTSRVNKAGDTMTGPLNISYGAGRAFIVQGKENPPSLAPTDAYANFVSANGGFGALSIGGRSASPYSTWLQSHNSGGTVLPLEINTAGGNVGIGKTPVTTLDVAGNITAAPNATTGTYYFGNSGTKSLSYDGTGYSLAGGQLYVTGGNIVASADMYLGYTVSTGALHFSNNISKQLNYDGTNFNLVGGQLLVGSNGVWSGAGGATGLYLFGSTGTKYLNYDGTNFNFAGGALNVPGTISAINTPTTGFFSFGSSGTKYLGYDGTNYNLVGGKIFTPGFTSTESMQAYNSASPTTGAVYFGNTLTKYLFYDGSGFNLIGGTVTTSNHVINASASNALTVNYPGGGVGYGIVLYPAADTTNAIYFGNVAHTGVGSISVTAAATAYNTSSSADLKEDLKSFDAGNIVDDTNVYDFKWKSTGERSYGVIAQQAVEVYPTAVTHTVNPETEDEFWGVDYSKYVPVLLQELKALRTRVAALEGRIDAKPA